ncbi:nitroreductase family protein [Pseudoramibacter faecis]|uniref:nitroreductase family protein n=1 Tax=Pseudoramibacter faecis TaxID=3108534 RepID=UPI002E76B1EF|nr:nitroreductase family protein [Pseudoramibacter sp. HA2172]
MDLIALLQTRRTYRRFDESHPVAAEAVADMAEALRLSSSARNLQPLRAIFVTDRAQAAAIFPHVHFAAALPKALGTPRPGERPTMYVALIYDGSCKSRWVDTDAGIALANLTLAAWHHGVGSCIMDNIDREALAAVLELPGPMAVHSVVALGYPTHRSTVVTPGPDGSLQYYLDANRDYFVPKRDVDEIVMRDRWTDK